MKLRHEIENQPLVAGDGFKQIGLTLKDARFAGLSMGDISEKLRISVDFLTKLETGAFNDLPAPVYVLRLSTKLCTLRWA